MRLPLLLATGVGAFEVIPPAEADEIEATAAIMPRLITLRAETVDEQEGNLLRGVHAKSHGCVKATFTVNDIAPEYQVGLFATPGKEYDSWIRFSNASALREDDLKVGGTDGTRKNGSRGMAIKILDVEGETLNPDSDANVQDFLMINTPMFAFPDVRSYHRLNEVLLRSAHGDSPNLFFFPLQPGAELPPPDGQDWGEVWADFSPDDRARTKETLDIIQTEIEGPQNTVRNPAQVQYFGAAPFMFGEDKAMKVSAIPCNSVKQTDFPDRMNPTDPSPDYLRDALSQSMQGGENLCYDFKIQTRTPDELTPEQIEDATTLWPEELNRYTNVARITIPVPQNTNLQEAKDHCESLAFSPFHALAAHRPIGGINRVRKDVYEQSATHRGAQDY